VCLERRCVRPPVPQAAAQVVGEAARVQGPSEGLALRRQQRAAGVRRAQPLGLESYGLHRECR